MDDNLAKNITMARTRKKDNPLYFALVLKGGSDGALLVDKKRPGKADIEVAKKTSGGSAVVQGVCYGADGVIQFATAKAPAPAWDAAVRKIVSRDAGVAIKAEFVLDSDLADTPGDGEIPPAPPPSVEPPAQDTEEQRFRARLQTCEKLMGELQKRSPDQAKLLQVMLNLAHKRDADKNYKQGLGVLAELAERLKTTLRTPAPQPAASAAPPSDAAFTARLKALLPKIKDALLAKAPGANDANLLATDAGISARQRDLEQANRLLDEAEALVTKGLQAIEAQNAAAFTARLRGLLPELNKAVASGSATGQEVKLKTSEASLFARKKDYEQANRLLNQVEALLRQAPPDDAAKQEWEKGLAGVQAAYDQAVNANPTNAKKLQAIMAFATKQAQAGQYAKSLAALAQLKPLLPTQDAEETEKAAEETGKDAEETAPPPNLPMQGVVAFRKSLLKWSQAQDSVRPDIRTLQAAILKDFPDDDEAIDAALELNEIMDGFKGGLADAALDAAVNAATDEERRQKQLDALAEVKKNQKLVQQHEQIKHADNNPFVKINIGGRLSDSLAEVAAQLRG